MSTIEPTPEQLTDTSVETAVEPTPVPLTEAAYLGREFFKSAGVIVLIAAGVVSAQTAGILPVGSP